MASRTQIRVQQLTGSLATSAAAGAINTSLVATSVADIDATSLEGILGHAFSAIKRIHGKSGNDATGNATGTFYATLKSDSTGNVDIGSTTDADKFGDVFLGDGKGLQIGAAEEHKILDGAPGLTINSSEAISIGNEAIAAAINVGTGAAARTITIGNETGATAVDIDAGTGGLALDAQGTGAIGIGTQTDTGAINIGTGASARTVTIGNVSGATAVNINAGTGGSEIATTGGGDITLDSADKISLEAANASTDSFAVISGGGAKITTATSRGTLIKLGADTVNETFKVENDTGDAALTVDGLLDVSIGRNATISGNLTVNGTTTTVNSTTVSIDDQFILLADGAQANNTPAGIVFASGSNVPARPDVAFARVANDTWALGTVASNSGSNTDSVPANFDVALRAFKIELGAAAEHITADGTDVTIAGGSGDITLDAADDIILDAGGDRIDLKKAGTLFGAFDMSVAGDLLVKDAGGDEIFRIDGSENGLAIPNNTNVSGGGGNGGMLTFNGVTNQNAAIYGNAGNLFLRSGNNKVRMPVLAGNANDVMITDGTNGNLSFVDADSLITDVNGRATYKVMSRISAGAKGLILTSSQFDDNTKPSHMFATSSPCYTGSLADSLFAVGDDKKAASVEMYVNGQLLASGAAVANAGVHADADYNLVSVTQSQISASFAFDLEIDDMVTLVLR